MVLWTKQTARLKDKEATPDTPDMAVGRRHALNIFAITTLSSADMPVIHGFTATRSQLYLRLFAISALATLAIFAIPKPLVFWPTLSLVVVTQSVPKLYDTAATPVCACQDELVNN